MTTVTTECAGIVKAMCCEIDFTIDGIKEVAFVTTCKPEGRQVLTTRNSLPLTSQQMAWMKSCCLATLRLECAGGLKAIFSGINVTDGGLNCVLLVHTVKLKCVQALSGQFPLTLTSRRWHQGRRVCDHTQMQMLYDNIL